MDIFFSEIHIITHTHVNLVKSCFFSFSNSPKQTWIEHESLMYTSEATPRVIRTQHNFGCIFMTTVRHQMKGLRLGSNHRFPGGFLRQTKKITQQQMRPLNVGTTTICSGVDCYFGRGSWILIVDCCLLGLEIYPPNPSSDLWICWSGWSRDLKSNLGRSGWCRTSHKKVGQNQQYFEESCIYNVNI